MLMTHNSILQLKTEQNVQVGGAKEGTRSKIKNLVVTFDQTLSTQAHLDTIAKKTISII